MLISYRQSFKGNDISKIPHDVPHEQAALLVERRVVDGIIEKTEDNIKALENAFTKANEMMGVRFILKRIATKWNIALK